MLLQIYKSFMYITMQMKYIKFKRDQLLLIPYHLNICLCSFNHCCLKAMILSCVNDISSLHGVLVHFASHGFGLYGTQQQ